MEKQTYVVAEGVSTVNGQPVPESREIELTEREALFDLGLGRIELKRQVPLSKHTGRKAKSGNDDETTLIGEV